MTAEELAEFTRLGWADKVVGEPFPDGDEALEKSPIKGRQRRLGGTYAGTPKPISCFTLSPRSKQKPQGWYLEHLPRQMGLSFRPSARGDPGGDSGGDGPIGQATRAEVGQREQRTS